MNAQDYEKLGVFFLGRPFDIASRKGTDIPVLYDSKDLVTHAVCVGMTGSGKTGLCLALLEEAAIDGIPAILIDPKGDLANLLLTFPDLKPENFRPWINEDDAKRKGVSPDDYAAQQADMWLKGLASWGQAPDRIKKLKESAEFAIYTPGSNAGIPVAVLKSFDAPTASVMEDGELLQDLVRTTATSVLGLIGIDADPVQSREHILISNLLNYSWKDGKGLDLAALIQQIQQPPMEKVGVLDINSFFPQKDRFTLAMKLNNLLAAPGFENWISGEPLDISKILYTPAGKPRVAIMSIAHLSDAERMFFVSLLLNQMLGWVRSQSGTTSLRALLYMDEIFGYFPPVANPPSKMPLLTLLKQARAFGVGVVLATQNPVDLDYKGLANCGTWFIGRLQTDRDKQRVLDGLEGAANEQSGKFDRAKMEQTLASLGSRVFLMNNVKESAPMVFESRWALSYLRGPLTRSQIKVLMDDYKKTRGGAVAPASAAVAPAPAVATPEAPVAPTTRPAAPATRGVSSARPVIPPEIQQLFIPIRSAQPDGAALLYKPVLLGATSIYFNNDKTGVRTQNDETFIAEISSGPVAVDWAKALQIDVPVDELLKEPEQSAAYGSVPSAAANPKNFDLFKKSLNDSLYRTASLSVFQSPGTEEVSKPGESEKDFRLRLQQVFREQRDAAVEKIRQKYAAKVASLEDRIRRAQLKVDEQQRQSTASKFQTAISFGAAILGAFMGRKAVSAGTIGKAATAARGVGRSMKEASDVNLAQESVAGLQGELEQLQADIKAEQDAVSAQMDPANEKFEELELKPKKTDITIKFVSLTWTPYWSTPAGEVSAWE